MSRGDRREDIYLTTWIGRTLSRPWPRPARKGVAGACLLPDAHHYHLVLETPHPNLVPGMAWLQSTTPSGLTSRH